MRESVILGITLAPRQNDPSDSRSETKSALPEPPHAYTSRAGSWGWGEEVRQGVTEVWPKSMGRTERKSRSPARNLGCDFPAKGLEFQTQEFGFYAAGNAALRMSMENRLSCSCWPLLGGSVYFFLR